MGISSWIKMSILVQKQRKNYAVIVIDLQLKHSNENPLKSV